MYQPIGYMLSGLLAEDKVSMTFHSLIIPTRNRPEYIAVAVGTYLTSHRDDIECLVCDGSDTPDAVHQALSRFLSDPRFKLIDNTVKSTGIVPSMQANWSRGLDAVNARWLSVVGDDDVLDPALIDYLSLLEQRASQIEAVNWPAIAFDIGLHDDDGFLRLMPAKIPMGHQTLIVDARATLMSELTWPKDKKPPGMAVSLYHGAIRRSLLERIRSERDGQWFRFQTVDYDLGWSIAARVGQTVMVQRPFSINGHGQKSNSWSIGKLSARRERGRQWLAEAKVIDGWQDITAFVEAGVEPDFFYTLPIVMYGFRQAFAAVEGLSSVPFNLNNFLNTMIWDCRGQADETSFAWYLAQIEKFLLIFLPQPMDLSNVRWLGGVREPVFVGLQDKTLAFDRRLVDGDLGRFAALAFRMVPPVQYCFS